MKTKNTFFVLFSKPCFNFRAHARQSKLNKVSISNFVKFQFQSMSSKFERAFEKRTTFSIKIKLIKTLIRQQKRTINQCKKNYMRKKPFFFKK